MARGAFWCSSTDDSGNVLNSPQARALSIIPAPNLRRAPFLGRSPTGPPSQTPTSFSRILLGWGVHAKLNL